MVFRVPGAVREVESQLRWSRCGGWRGARVFVSAGARQWLCGGGRYASFCTAKERAVAGWLPGTPGGMRAPREHAAAACMLSCNRDKAARGGRDRTVAGVATVPPPHAPHACTPSLLLVMHPDVPLAPCGPRAPHVCRLRLLLRADRRGASRAEGDRDVCLQWMVSRATRQLQEPTGPLHRCFR